VKLKIASKSSYHHGDLENSLVKAAIALVKKYGPDHLSLRAVSAEVGVSPSASYHYFSDKTALVSAVGKVLFDELANKQETAINKIKGSDAKSSVDKFQALGYAYFEWALAEPNLYRLMFGGFCDFDFEHDENRAWKLLQNSLDDLLANGVITKNVRENGEAFVWAAVHGASSLIIEGLMPKESYPLIINRVGNSFGINLK
jgi:AcrR family transcriptional regulator